MKQQVKKIEFTADNTAYDIPNGWTIDKFLDVTGNYAIVVLTKEETAEEYNVRMGYTAPPIRAYDPMTTTAGNFYTGGIAVTPGRVR